MTRATLEYQPGEVISSVDHPLVHILFNEFKFHHCDECFSKDKPVKKCTACHQVAYCSRHCQSVNWLAGHRWECPLFRTPSADDDWFTHNGNNERLILRVWLQYSNKYAGLTRSYPLHDGTTRSFRDLMSNTTHLGTDPLTQNYLTNQLIPLFTRHALVKTQEDSANLIIIWGKLKTNSFAITDGVDPPLGGALYMETSIFDHSCVPNATPIWDGIKMEIRALKPIRINEEIYIHYIDLIQTSRDRQSLLRAKYKFDCACTRCIRWISPVGKLNRTEEEVIKMIHKNQDTISNLSTDRKDIKRIVEAVCLEIECYELVLPILGPYHSQLTNSLLFVASLIFHLAEIGYKGVLDRVIHEGVKQNAHNPQINFTIKNELEWVQQTDRSLKVTHGDNHSVAQKFKQESDKYLKLESKF